MQPDQPQASTGGFFSRQAMVSIPWLVASKVFTFVLYFVVSVVIVRGLSAADYGVYSLLNSIAENLAVVGAFGLNVSLLRFIPELVRDNNRAGLLRLLMRSALLEILVLVAIGVGLYLLHNVMTTLLHIPFILFLIPTLALTGMLVAKDYLNNVFTALFRVRVVAMMSALQAVLFLLCLWLAAPLSVGDVLFSYSGSIAGVSLISSGLLCLYLWRWRVQSPALGVGRRRVLNLSLPTLANAVSNKFLQQYSEIFFLGYFAAAQVVGYYALGYMLANLLLTFIPMALHTLFTSAFAESYARHRASLGNLISGMYQILIIICLPLSILGAFFASQAVVVIYGEKMAAAGLIASFFCVFQAFTLLWIPLSMALTATEKVAKTMWLNVLQLIVNLVLDYVLIKRFGVPGALAAVSLTFLITVPIKLWVLRGLLGGIYFPWSFAVRTMTPALVLAAILSLILPPLNLLGLVVMAVGYLILWGLTLKLFHLIRPHDTERFRSIEIHQLNRVLNFFTS